MKNLFITIVYLILVITSCKKNVIDTQQNSTQNSTSIGNTTFKVELNHSYSTNVYLIYTVNSIVTTLEMDKISDYIYSISTDLSDSVNYLFNIKVTSTNFPDAVLWIGKPVGIDAISVMVNETTITNSFLVKTEDSIASNNNPSAAFSIKKNDNVVTVSDGVKWNPDSNIPPEVPQYHYYCRLKLPPQGFTTALPWMHALHNGTESDSSKVEVDYIKFYAYTSTGDTLLYEDNYNTDFSLTGYEHGGTYLRYPFFYDEENNNWSMPAEANNGSLIILTQTYKNKVFHWWLSQRIIIPQDAEYLKVETKVRITGSACVQVALDFWVDQTSPYAGLDVNNTEAGVSDFIFGTTNDWQVVTFSTETLAPWVD